MTQDQKEGRKQQQYWYLKCNLVLEDEAKLVLFQKTDYRVTNQVWMWEERDESCRHASHRILC